MFPRKLQTIRLLNAAAATGPGPAHEVTGERLGFYIAVTLTATVKIETSPDGVAWFDTSIVSKTANGYFPLNELHRYVRANVTAFTSGTVTVDLAQQV
jgi:hypothetical protein